MNDYTQTITSEQFKELLPLAAAWAQEQESLILRNGEPLTDELMDYARELKITRPEKVRLLSVDSIPTPSNPLLREAAEITQLLGPQTIGLSLRYGIFIRSDCPNEMRPEIIVHELVHTSQYEKLGGILPFLQQYLLECITIGYLNSPLEEEAVMTAEKLLG